MKNLLIIGTADNVGGAAKVGWDIGSNIRKYGFKVKYIVGYKSSNSANVYELENNKLLRMLQSKFEFNFIGLFRFFRSFILANDIDFGASEEILSHPWYKEADIVHCHNLHGNYFKLKTLSKIASEKPTVWTLHDAWALTAHCAHCFDCKNYNNGKHFTPGISRYNAMLWDNSNYLWNKKRRIYKEPAKLHLVVPSKWLKERVENSILKDKPLTVINNGIDTKIFNLKDKLRVRKLLGLPQNKKIIVYVGQMGRVDKSKGGDYFFEVAKYFSKDPNIIFLCVGGFSGNKLVKKGNIIFTPYVGSKNKLSLYYSASDILLFTSLAENFPLVPLEAMSCGLPVVGFDVGGVKEQVEHKLNGYVARYKDAGDLLSGLKYVLSLDDRNLEEMHLANRKRAVEKYTLDRMVANYAKLYKSVL